MINAQTEYVLHYRHGGRLWATSFFAVDDADAEAKVQSLKASLELKGRLIGSGETLEQAAENAAQNEAEATVRRSAGQI